MPGCPDGTVARWAAGTAPAAPEPAAKPRTCRQKARRIKNKTKRAKAIRACKRAAKRRKSTARAAAAEEGAAAFSPFTACAGGSRTRQMHLETLDRTNETVKGTVGCTSGAADDAGGAGSILDGIPPSPPPLDRG